MSVRLSCILTPAPDVVDHARVAEASGYECVWINDSPALYPDVWMVLTRIAEATSRIKLGPGVLVPSLRHVMTNASAIASLEALAPHRVVAAVGTGFTGRAMLGQRPLPWLIVAEYVQNLRALLAGDIAVVDGAPIKLLHIAGFTPTPPLATPILVAATGARGRAVAREVGDGVISVGGPQPGFDWSVLAVSGTVLEDGEDLTSERVVDAIGAYVAMRIRFAARAHLSLAGATRPGTSPGTVDASTQHLETFAGHCVEVHPEEFVLLTPERFREFTITGSPEEVQNAVRDFEVQGATEIAFRPGGRDVARELTAFARAVGVA